MWSSSLAHIMWSLAVSVTSDAMPSSRCGYKARGCCSKLCSTESMCSCFICCLAPFLTTTTITTTFTNNQCAGNYFENKVLCPGFRTIMPGPDEALHILGKDSRDFFSTMGTGLTWFFSTILWDFVGAPLLKSSMLLDTNLHLAPSRAVQYLEVFRNFNLNLSLYLRMVQ